ncbi:MAG: glucose-6-phosphate isomerase, partial [Alphaproteobacteria bacterium]
RNLLIDLAKTRQVEKQRDSLFNGDAINTTENRAVLHTALRGSFNEALSVNAENIAEFVESSLEKIAATANKIRDNKNITDIVNIGIGGSDLGAKMACWALHNFHSGPRTHFVSNVDGAEITHTLKSLRPENTAFIISSKTFTTLETMTNAETAKAWAGGTENFYAVTMNETAAQNFGIAPENTLPMRDWIGGRTSLWSAVGLPIAVAIGNENFKSLLAGAKDMDTHFQTAPLNANMPVTMALMGIWYRNFMGFSTHAVLPYAAELDFFPSFLQQLDMESNGKSIDRDGNEINYATAPVLFGAAGTNAQHAFMQLMHQGTDTIPADFILIKTPGHDLTNHHRKLNANALAQAEALMSGSPAPGGQPHRKFPGNRPSSTLVLDRLDPRHLGALIALYEHKTSTQGFIWNINSFDQWGVELGKTLAKDILDDKTGNSSPDQTTHALRHIIEI